MDKGTASNLISAAVFGTGLALPASSLQSLALTTGMFAFSGGITNTLAVKMLFDRVPGLVGSGVIPARFREIRVQIRELILTHFFDDEHLRTFFNENRGMFSASRYLKHGGASGGVVSSLIENQWEKMTRPDVIQPIVDGQIEKLMESSMGGLLAMVGTDNVKPAVGQFVTGLLEGLKDKVIDAAGKLDGGIEIELDEESILEDIRRHADRLLDSKLQQLDAQTVKKMLEDVIRSHLGWLIVWGNVFGGLLGFLAYLLRL